MSRGESAQTSRRPRKESKRAKLKRCPYTNFAFQKALAARCLPIKTLVALIVIWKSSLKLRVKTKIFVYAASFSAACLLFMWQALAQPRGEESGFFAAGDDVAGVGIHKAVHICRG